MDKKVINSMFENLLHIGNKSNYWNPKMKNYIYGAVNGIHVLDLTKTYTKLEEVKKQLNTLASEGKKILFVATKIQARDTFSKLAKDTGHYYVTEKWVPGLLTNFKTIKRRISTYLNLSRDIDNGAFDVLTKKEKAAKMLEFEKLDRAFRGLKEMKRPPEVLFVVDGIYEKQAVKEGNSLGVSIFSILNTNGDDSVVTNLIPSNTNSVKSLDFIASELSSVLKGVKVTPKKVFVKKTPIKKMQEKKVSETKEEKKEVAKKDPAKKTVAKTATKKTTTAKKAPAKKTVKKEEK